MNKQQSEHFIESSFCKEDLTFEVPLRPQSLQDFIGQNSVRDRLEVLIGAAKKRKEALGHCLFSGPPGLGKTTLSYILSQAMGTNLCVTSGPVIEKAGDLAGILTNLKEGDILFIDEIHRMNRAVEEYLYSAMEDFVLDLLIDSGPNARSVQVKLNRFTLVGATTRLGLLSSPLRSRFAFNCRLDYYDVAVLEQVILRTARILNIQIDKEAARTIAMRARGTPRIANNLLKWVRDYAQMRADNKVTAKIVVSALDMLEIDDCGLDEMDKKILRVIIDHYDGGPVGLNTIAIAVGEESTTLEEVHEPYLVMQGFIERTPRGRKVTSLGYRHMGKQTRKSVRSRDE
jgi:Holliday junction DNA helicase RuvB